MDQNEIDISPLVSLINTAIQRVSQSLKTLWKKRVVLLIAFILGLGASYFLHQDDTEIYRSTITVSSPALNNADAAQLVFEIRDYIFDENYAALAERMNCSEDFASKILSISYTGRFSEQFNSRKLPKDPEVYTINIKYPKGTNLRKVQEAFQYFFNHHDYALKKQFDAAQELKFQILLHEHQKRTIDSLLVNIPTQELYRTLVPQEQLPVSSLLQEAKNLELQIAEYNKTLQEIQKGNLQVITPFIEQIHCEKNIDYNKIAQMALLFPLVFALVLITVRKK